MHWFIYVLKNPRTQEVRYVGKTGISAETRLGQHVTEAIRTQKSYRNRGILSLVSIGLIPLIEVIETGSGHGWGESEKRWIRFYRERGARLWNTGHGGEGNIVGFGTPERRSKAVKQGNAKRTPEQRKAMAERCRLLTAARTSQQTSEMIKRAWASATPEERVARIQSAGDAQRALSPAQRSANAKKANAARTAEERRDARRNQIANTTHEQRSASARKGVARMTSEALSASRMKIWEAKTPEQRSDARTKGWETRRARAAAK
jgi:hypothetical protein